jgi:hypothetical protein
MTPPAAAAPAARRAHGVAPGRPLTTAPRPRRVSGPTRPARPRPADRQAAPSEKGLTLGVLAALRGVEGNPLLDRAIRGRVWIVLVAFALIGIVTLQLGLLKLNANIGRTLEQTASLQRENATLSIENSEAASGDRVETSAAHLGMELVPIGALRFLASHPASDAVHAAQALSVPVSDSGSTSEAANGSSSTESSSPTSSSGSATSTPASGEQSASATTSEQQPSVAPPGAPDGEAAAPTGASSAAASVQAPVDPAPAVTTQQPSTGSAGASSPVEATAPVGTAGGAQSSPSG